MDDTRTLANRTVESDRAESVAAWRAVADLAATLPDQIGAAWAAPEGRDNALTAWRPVEAEYTELMARIHTAYWLTWGRDEYEGRPIARRLAMLRFRLMGRS